MAMTIDPMKERNFRRRRAEEAKRFPPPRPVKTLATMTEAERQEMLRLYGAGPKRSVSR